MKLLLKCTECEYVEHGSQEREMMNKIIMWNHVKKVHPMTEARILRSYETVPNHLYSRVLIPTTS